MRIAITLSSPLHMQLGQRSGRPGMPGRGARLARSLARMRAERERGGARRPRDLRRLRRSAYASRWSDASSSDSDAWRHQARGLVMVQTWQGFKAYIVGPPSAAGQHPHAARTRQRVCCPPSLKLVARQPCGAAEDVGAPGARAGRRASPAACPGRPSASAPRTRTSRPCRRARPCRRPAAAPCPVSCAGVRALLQAPVRHVVRYSHDLLVYVDA